LTFDVLIQHTRVVAKIQNLKDADLPFWRT